MICFAIRIQDINFATGCCKITEAGLACSYSLGSLTMLFSTENSSGTDSCREVSKHDQQQNTPTLLPGRERDYDCDRDVVCGVGVVRDVPQHG